MGLAGGLAGGLVSKLGPWPALVLSVLGAVIAVFSYRENVAEESYSVTTAIAAFVTLLLGAFAVVGEPAVAVSAGVAAVALLAARESLHGWLKQLTWRELRSGLVILAMSFIALPLLPNRAIDPWGAVNPYELWLLTILIAAISAAGDGAMRIGGPRRGLLFGALAGALVSSTAVTFSLANRAKGRAGVMMLAGAAALASSVSLLRAAVIVATVSPAHSDLFLTALLPAAGLTLGIGVIAWRRGVRTDGASTPAQFELGNPLDLGEVIRFAALLSIVLLLSKVAQAEYGDAGFLTLAGLAGSVDVDPVTLAAARLANAGETHIGLAGALLALLLNMATKLTVGLVAGGRRFGVAHLMLVGPAVLILTAWLAWALMVPGP
ncbi:MAG: DUF4010 domain-containing protein [Alphaproteobacteria bacterium]